MTSPSSSPRLLTLNDEPLTWPELYARNERYGAIREAADPVKPVEYVLVRHTGYGGGYLRRASDMVPVPSPSRDSDGGCL